MLVVTAFTAVSEGGRTDANVRSALRKRGVSAFPELRSPVDLRAGGEPILQLWLSVYKKSAALIGRRLLLCVFRITWKGAQSRR